MFTKQIETSRIQIGSASVSLSRSLLKSVTKHVRNDRAYRIREAIKSEDGAECAKQFELAKGDAQGVELIKKELLKERNRLKHTLAALEDGTIPQHPADLTEAAIDAYGLAKMIRELQPDSYQATELFTETIETLRDTIQKFDDFLQYDTRKSDRNSGVIEAAAKGAFAFSPDIGKMIDKGDHYKLPEAWRKMIDPATEYGTADMDRYGPPENIAASMLALKFRKLLDGEAADRERAARERAADAARDGFTSDLRGVNG